MDLEESAYPTDFLDQLRELAKDGYGLGKSLPLQRCDILFYCLGRIFEAFPLLLGGAADGRRSQIEQAVDEGIWMRNGAGYSTQAS